MALSNPAGVSAVLRNRNFRALWLAQVLSNTALNASFFLSIILIEDITGSSTQLAGVIIAFTFPSVLFSALAGVVVDRVPKKHILIASNALRVALTAALALLAWNSLTNRGDGWLFLAGVYLLVFLSSAVGQFFAPAEGATIPLLVKENQLLSANSLFSLTLTASQVVAVVLLAPLGTKLIGITASLWAVAAMYVGATIFIARIPRDAPPRHSWRGSVSTLARAVAEIREGWEFALRQRGILIALLQLSVGAALTMIMTMLAPGYAARVLGLRVEDAILVFWPVGAGMFLASLLIGRYGNRVRRETLAAMGVLGIGLALAGLAFAGRIADARAVPILLGFPAEFLSASAVVMFFAFWIGATIALINIPAQTIVQERSTDAVRGRVYAVQFTLSSALGIPPMLFVGTLADLLGIPRVTVIIAIVLVGIGIVNLVWTVSTSRRARARTALPDSFVAPPKPSSSSDL